MKQSASKLEKKIARKEFISQGGMDGRFRARVVPDKKKQANKRLARTKSWE